MTELLDAFWAAIRWRIAIGLIGWGQRVARHDPHLALDLGAAALAAATRAQARANTAIANNRRHRNGAP